MLSLESNSGCISPTIDRLRHCTQLDVQSQWLSCALDRPIPQATHCESWQDWLPITLNARHHIAWDKGQQVLWLGQRIVVPPDLKGYPLEGLSLRLALTWWAISAQIFVNGTLVQEGDLFDCSTRLLLSAAVQPGDGFEVALRLVSSGHDNGALVRSRCLYEVPTVPLDPYPEPGFIADELAVVQQYVTTFEPDQMPRLEEAIARLDWSQVGDRPAFDHSLAQLRKALLPLGQAIQQRQIYLLGHAHLDLAWLWPLSETWDVAERTFQSVLQLQQEFPELIFCHSTPALYAWIESNRPALFEAIRDRIAAGQWEVVAGLWIEPELNLVSGESLVRQVLYGQRYVQEKFGVMNQIAWLPDSFGFCWQLPQILRQGGVNYFVTQKLRWNDTTQFPHEVFWWRSPDGSEILSLMSSPLGEGIDPVRMATYACIWEQKTGIPFTGWLIGVGDHGGGPTRDMLELARRWEHSPFFPQLKFKQALGLLEEIQTWNQGQALGSQDWNTANPSAVTPGSVSCSPSPFPTWSSDLYLEFHRGCYTTHADQKRQNRRCERLLYQAELFAALATLIAKSPYPESEIETAWKQVLFNQFHDILPGSSIPEVFVDANQSWATAQQQAEQILAGALEAIAPHIGCPAPPTADCYPILVFNSLNWSRTEVVSLLPPHLPDPDKTWVVVDLAGEPLPMQSQLISGRYQVLFQARDIPGVGYRRFWLTQIPNLSPPPAMVEEGEWTGGNEFFRFTVNPDTGNLESLVDRVQQREMLSAPGNQLQAFQDQGQYWDAWNIDPAYENYPLPPAPVQSIAWLERGVLQSRLRVVRWIGRSQFCQDYIVQAGSPLLKIETTVDWQETHVLVKAAFPVQVEAPVATYEIPCGAIERPTLPLTEQEQAQWEVPALHWADLSDERGGVSLLSDYKHGYDSQPFQLRLSLLRGSCWPDPEADRGHHVFTYAIYPHEGSWQTAQTVRRGYEFTQPLMVKLGAAVQKGHEGCLAATAQLLNLQADSFILSAFKRSEESSDSWILRGYECHGQSTVLPFDALFPGCEGTVTVQRSNLLEESLPEGKQTDSGYLIHPWEIASFRLTPQLPEA